MSVDFWIQTKSGRAWPILNPQPSDVDWLDMAMSLAAQVRFTGHCDPWYSVAEHCCRVHDAIYEFSSTVRLYALLHDAHEVVIGDQSSPYKAAMRYLGASEAYDTIRRAQDQAIFIAAGLPVPIPVTIAQRVEDADRVLLATEVRDLMAPPPRPWLPLPDPLHEKIEPWSPRRAANEWIYRLRKLRSGLV